MIKCDFGLCIYNQKNECILDTITISAEAGYEDCLAPVIPEEIINKYKQELLEKYPYKHN